MRDTNPSTVPPEIRTQSAQDTGTYFHTKIHFGEFRKRSPEISQYGSSCKILTPWIEDHAAIEEGTQHTKTFHTQSREHRHVVHKD
jgi:hypothetical protein